MGLIVINMLPDPESSDPEPTIVVSSGCGSMADYSIWSGDNAGSIPATQTNLQLQEHNWLQESQDNHSYIHKFKNRQKRQ